MKISVLMEPSPSGKPEVRLSFLITWFRCHEIPLKATGMMLMSIAKPGEETPVHQIMVADGYVVQYHKNTPIKATDVPLSEWGTEYRFFGPLPGVV